MLTFLCFEPRERIDWLRGIGLKCPGLSADRSKRRVNARVGRSVLDGLCFYAGWGPGSVYLRA